MANNRQLIYKYYNIYRNVNIIIHPLKIEDNYFLIVKYFSFRADQMIDDNSKLLNRQFVIEKPVYMFFKT